MSLKQNVGPWNNSAIKFDPNFFTGTKASSSKLSKENDFFTMEIRSLSLISSAEMNKRCVRFQQKEEISRILARICDKN